MRALLSRGGGIVNRARRPHHIAAAPSHAMPRSMSEDRLALALDRMEHALARVATASAGLAQTAAAEIQLRESLQAQLDRLDARHRRLRASAASAIEQLDGLIAPGAAEAQDG